jgi:hypothetical protein
MGAPAARSTSGPNPGAAPHRGWNMELPLRYPPVAANGPRFAADIVTIVREGGGIRLDYSAESLQTVDRVIEDIRGEAPAYEAIAHSLVGFGTYVGEVLVRQAQARWTDFEESHRELYGHTFGVRTPDGQVWDPVGRAFKRYLSGAEYSVYLLYLDVRGHVRV